MANIFFNQLPLGHLFFFVLLLLLLSACHKGAGEGGTASLTGRVYVEDYNCIGQLVDEYYAAAERVYIIYGNNPVFDDQVRTNFDGTYQFKYLYRGTYTIFTYSDCDTCASGSEPIFQTVEIKRRGEDVQVPLIITKN